MRTNASTQDTDTDHLMVAQLVQQHHDTPKIVSLTRTGIVIPAERMRPWQMNVEEEPLEQRTLRGRLVGIPALTWKHYRYGSTSFTPWPINGSKRYLMMRLATRRHGILTLPLPPSAADELLRLEAELGSVTNVDLVVSMIDKGGYFFATFAKARTRRAV